MRWVTELGGPWVVIGTGIALLVIDLPLGLAVLAAVAMSGVVVQVLKRGFGSRRPWNPTTDAPQALIKLPDPFSFPSGHTAAITAVTATICLRHPVLIPALLPVAVLVGASRVTLRVHFVGDVLAGASIGLVAAVASWALFYS